MTNPSSLEQTTAVPPPVPSRPDAEALHAYLEHHRKPDEILYAIVDAAKDYRLAIASRDILGEPLRPLFSTAPRFMERVGPYLARIEQTSRYLEYMNLWSGRLDDNAGFFFFSKAWPQAVRKHMRMLFKVYDETGHMYYFRFYDPRVLRAYLPTCTAKECREFFGPMRCILVESGESGVMHQYTAGKAAVHLEQESVFDIAGSTAD